MQTGEQTFVASSMGNRFSRRSSEMADPVPFINMLMEHTLWVSVQLARPMTLQKASIWELLILKGSKQEHIPWNPFKVVIFCGVLPRWRNCFGYLYWGKRIWHSNYYAI